MLRDMLKYTYCLLAHSNQFRNILDQYLTIKGKKNTATSADFSLFEFNEFTSKNQVVILHLRNKNLFLKKNNTKSEQILTKFTFLFVIVFNNSSHHIAMCKCICSTHYFKEVQCCQLPSEEAHYLLLKTLWYISLP